jgi:hypothetical protein
MGKEDYRRQQLKAAKPAIHVEFVFDFQAASTPLWWFDGSCSTSQLLCLFSEFAVEFRQHPKEAVRVPHDYFGEGFAAIFAKWHPAPMHVVKSFSG